MASRNSPDARPSTTTVLSSDEALALLTAWPRRVVSPKGRSCFGGPKRLDLPAPRTTPTTLIVGRPGPRLRQVLQAILAPVSLRSSAATPRAARRAPP